MPVLATVLCLGCGLLLVACGDGGAGPTSGGLSGPVTGGMAGAGGGSIMNDGISSKTGEPAKTP
jgi:hypothetical protein